ncbi:P-loop containing nucleoside triphosphate hydrolase protein [Marasmius fiardii PR-910]|nr:P-loop containing nucleoside triphosphate hydrolase protein [Marasmius fiardii PR-910]
MDVVLQQILKLAGTENVSSSISNSTGVFGQQGHGAPSLTMNSIPSLIGLLFSFSALGDWLKLIVIGGFLETCRRLLFTLYDKAIKSFWINAYFEDEDAVYEWMMLWLAKQPSWKNTRDVEISTHTYGANTTSIQLSGEENASALFKSSRKLNYLPSLSTTYSLWYKGRYMTITRTQQQTGWYGHKERTLRISILARRQSVLVELLQEARDAYLADQAHSMCVFVSDINNNWKHVACRPKRSMRSIILDPGVKDMLLDDARDFLASKAWYAKRGIPFRRGYLLYGAPGSGKTSLIHSMAGELGLDVYIVSLSRVGLDDNSLGELINELPERCIALMEDIDAAFTHGVSRDSNSSTSTSSTPGSMNSPPTSGGSPPASGAASSNRQVCLSGLLNALDGVGAQEGRILFATTNKYSSLDPALCRPGRMDVHVEFKLSSKFQATELFTRFYNPFEHLEMKEDEHGVEKESDSGYGSVDGDAEGSVKPKTEDKGVKELNQHPLPPKLSGRQIRRMATQFGDALPEREFSMAALQGYLMLYKTRPFAAIQDFKDWIKKERTDREKKETEKKESETKAEREKKEKEDKEKEEKNQKEKGEKEEKDLREKMVKEMREKVEKEVREKVENEMRAAIEKELRGKIPT